MIARLSELDRRVAMLHFIVILIVAVFMILVSAVLLLSATILIPRVIFQSKALSLGLSR